MEKKLFFHFLIRSIPQVPRQSFYFIPIFFSKGKIVNVEKL